MMQETELIMNNNAMVNNVIETIAPMAIEIVNAVTNHIALVEDALESIVEVPSVIEIATEVAIEAAHQAVEPLTTVIAATAETTEAAVGLIAEPTIIGSSLDFIGQSLLFPKLIIGFLIILIVLSIINDLIEDEDIAVFSLSDYFIESIESLFTTRSFDTAAKARNNGAIGWYSHQFTPVLLIRGSEATEFLINNLRTGKLIPSAFYSTNALELTTNRPVYSGNELLKVIQLVETVTNEKLLNYGKGIELLNVMRDITSTVLIDGILANEFTELYPWERPAAKKGLLRKFKEFSIGHCSFPNDYDFHRAVLARENLVREIMLLTKQQTDKYRASDCDPSYKTLLVQLAGTRKEDGSPMSYIDVARQIMALIEVGFNSAQTLTNLFDFYCNNWPQFLKARNEQIKIFGEIEKPITVQNIKQMKYLNASLMEAMRLRHINSIPAQEATSNLEFGGCEIRPGTTVAIDTWASCIGINEHLAPIKRFEPERFMGPISKSQLSFNETVVFFGCDIYSDLAEQFAISLMKIVMSIGLRKLDWQYHNIWDIYNSTEHIKFTKFDIFPIGCDPCLENNKVKTLDTEDRLENAETEDDIEFGDSNDHDDDTAVESVVASTLLPESESVSDPSLELPAQKSISSNESNLVNDDHSKELEQEFKEKVIPDLVAEAELEATVKSEASSSSPEVVFSDFLVEEVVEVHFDELPAQKSISSYESNLINDVHSKELEQDFEEKVIPDLVAEAELEATVKSEASSSSPEVVFSDFLVEEVVEVHCDELPAQKSISSYESNLINDDHSKELEQEFMEKVIPGLVFEAELEAHAKSPEPEDLKNSKESNQSSNEEKLAIFGGPAAISERTEPNDFYISGIPKQVSSFLTREAEQNAFMDEISADSPQNVRAKDVENDISAKIVDDCDSSNIKLPSSLGILKLTLDKSVSIPISHNAKEFEPVLVEEVKSDLVLNEIAYNEFSIETVIEERFGENVEANFEFEDNEVFEPQASLQSTSLSLEDKIRLVKSSSLDKMEFALPKEVADILKAEMEMEKLEQNLKKKLLQEVSTFLEREPQYESEMVESVVKKATSVHSLPTSSSKTVKRRWSGWLWPAKSQDQN